MDSKVLKIRQWVAAVAVLVALAGGALLSQGFRNWTGHTVFGAPGSPIATSQNALPVSLGNFANGFSAVLKPALPAVVNISSSKVVKPERNQQPQVFNDPMFRQFFGDQFGQGQARPMREQSLGSGVILTSDGTILTNNHVVEGATDIKVSLSDKREFQAKVIGMDSKTDIAVLKIDATNLPTVPLGDSNQLQVGDLIFAIGDPFGVGETATMGIVSATGRGGFGIEHYENFIQTDAAINPGNSGGAMIDIHGNLVGINTAILSHGGGGEGGNEGVGFAIPMSMAKPIMDQILTHGKVVRGYLGVHIQELTPELARAFALKDGGGVLIGDVSPDTPAAQAGLKKGDVILQVNGQPVNAPNQLQVQISQFAPGTPIKLQIWHNGASENVSLKLAELSEHDDQQASSETSGAALEGVQVQDLTSDISQELNLPTGTHGVVVTSVDPSSPAAAAQPPLRRGDVIQEINHKPINGTSDYQQALAGADKQPVLILVNHGGVTGYVVVESH
ncbi:MAG TPA: DegQ family serine endoprotease [Candidatus Acidoferrales bacterium]|nr:DegQ family serine endoprotease [Candidatus Acidoferrales bacterium]